MKKKICFVVATPMTVNAFLWEPIKMLSQHYEIHLVVNGEFEDLSQALRDITTIHFLPIQRKISLLHDIVTLVRMTDLFLSNNFEAVHSVTPKAGLLAMIAAFLARIKLRTHTFTGQVWVTQSGVKRQFLKKFDQLIGFLATHILVDSISQRQFLINERVIPLRKSSVLAKGSISGVNTSRFKPNPKAREEYRRELQFDDDDIVFLFLGRLNRDKGVLDLARAFAKMAYKCPQIKLIMVGPDEENLINEIIGLIGDPSVVRFVNFSNKPENYMAAADVLCLPSYREGFGNVIIEAAAVGLPAIGSRIYGLTDAIAENQSGLLFEAGNIDDMQACMLRLVSDKELRVRLGKQARERVLAEYASQILAVAWLEYYKVNL